MLIYRTDASIEDAQIFTHDEAIAKCRELNATWIAAIAGDIYRHESEAAMGAGFRIACYRLRGMQLRGYYAEVQRYDHEEEQARLDADLEAHEAAHGL